MIISHHPGKIIYLFIFFDKYPGKIDVAASLHLCTISI